MFENKNINTKVSESEKNSSSTTQMAQIDVAQLVELDELSYSKTLNSSISLLQKKQILLVITIDYINFKKRLFQKKSMEILLIL